MTIFLAEKQKQKCYRTLIVSDLTIDEWVDVARPVWTSVRSEPSQPIPAKARDLVICTGSPPDGVMKVVKGDEGR